MTPASLPPPMPRTFTRRILVADRRNSASDHPLARLDWDNWWVDRSCGLHYLHVRAKDGDTWHRVICRHAGGPIIEMHEGRLFWRVP